MSDTGAEYSRPPARPGPALGDADLLGPLLGPGVERLYRDNLAKGQTGLSIAFDLPTQTGYDPDAPEAAGEVGKVGSPSPTSATWTSSWTASPSAR